MGATTFMTVGKGKTAEEAFKAAVEEASYLYGFGGYSGTISEKDSFVEVDCPEGKDPKEHARELLDNGDPRIEDKWGPAGCIKVKDGEYLFFGWASQ